MSTENNLNQTQEKSLLQLQLEELVKVGVGGKFKNQSDYLEKIQEELEFEEAMLRGGIDRYRKSVNEAKHKNQESTTLYGLVYQQKYIVYLSEMINEDVKQMNNGSAGLMNGQIK